MIFLYAFTGLCLLTFFLIIARYRRRAAVQELTFDSRLQQRLLEYKPQLPRPFVRCWYGGLASETRCPTVSRLRSVSPKRSARILLLPYFDQEAQQ